jgi:site-specific DNA-methyltransferase (adenine-specific)
MPASPGWKNKAKHAQQDPESLPVQRSRYIKPSSVIDTRIIYCGDCLEQLEKLPDECVDLVYIDPPFNSNRNYEVFWGETKEKRAFEDRHSSTAAYIDFMRPRCVQLVRVLKKTGSFYYHCDWHASHYVKVMLDQIFGENNFQNEIVWKRTSSHSDARRRFGDQTDALFFYSGGPDYTFNRQYVEYSDAYVKSHYSNVDENGRHFTTRDLRSPSPRPNLTYDYKGYKPHANGWSISREVMERWDAEGKLYFPQSKEGRIRVKRYLDEMPGTLVGNVWDDIEPVNSQAAERVGYPTQKPLALLERIIKASTNENDIILDAFCGCGTALEASQNLGRQWIGIDTSPTACRVMAKRLRDKCTLQENEALWRAGRGFVIRDLPWTEEKLRKIPPFEFENWAVIALSGIKNKAQVGDMGIDGRIYPVGTAPRKLPGSEGLAFMDDWYPIQVKQKDKTGRPDIDQFEAALMRENRTKGFFVSFAFTSDALVEIDKFFRRSRKVIVPLTVREILDEQIAHRLC